MELRLTWNYEANASLKLVIFLPHPPRAAIADCLTTRGITPLPVELCAHQLGLCALVPSCQEGQEQLSHRVAGEIKYGRAHEEFRPMPGIWRSTLLDRRGRRQTPTPEFGLQTFPSVLEDQSQVASLGWGLGPGGSLR